MTPPPPISTSLFIDRPDVYDAMIDWPGRLTREEPLYRWLLDQFHARRVLDVACGTGRHAALFHAWGLEVEGADVSPAMIAFCKKTHGESTTLRWTCRSFDQPAEGGHPVDVVLCKGNSLALAPDSGSAARAVGAMMQAVRPGGGCLIHLLNLPGLPEGPVQWQKKQRVMIAGHSCLLLKGIHRHKNVGYLETVVMRENAAPPDIACHCSRLLVLEEHSLQTLLLDHGAVTVEVYGSVAREAYDREHSSDLILVARRL
jgi:glycine/sarcosine N-methyltransferase